jgi:hypothetical protein
MAELREAKRRIRLLEQEDEVLRRTAAYLGQASLPRRRVIYPLVRGLAGDGIPVTVSCRILGFARPPYYRWLNEPVTAGQFDEAYRANAIFDGHCDDPEFGYRFLADEVRQGDHPEVSDRVVWRVCRDNQWWSAIGKPKRGKGSRPGAAAHDDLVRLDFTAERRTGCGWPTSASIAPPRASSTAARSRTCSRTGSSVGPSTSA